MERIFTGIHRVFVLELGIVCALPCSGTPPLRFLSRCLSAHVIGGPVAIYEEFYISGLSSKTLPSFQSALFTVNVSLYAAGDAVPC